MKQRQIHLDILRIIACLMVVLMHSPMLRSDASGLLYSGCYYLTSPCIGLFFMVSGALLLPPPHGRIQVLRNVSAAALRQGSSADALLDGVLSLRKNV